MIAKMMWDVTVRRIQGSRALKALALVCLADYLGFLWLTTSNRIDPVFAFVLFVFSVSCWFWAVTWPPFWNGLTLDYQNRSARQALSFVEKFGLLALFFVQTVYSVILAACLALALR